MCCRRDDAKMNKASDRREAFGTERGSDSPDGSVMTVWIIPWLTRERLE